MLLIITLKISDCCYNKCQNKIAKNKKNDHKIFSLKRCSKS